MQPETVFARYSPTRQAPGRAHKRTPGCGPDSRAQERTPANRKRDAGQESCDDNENHHAGDFPTSCHVRPSLRLILLRPRAASSLCRPERTTLECVRGYAARDFLRVQTILDPGWTKRPRRSAVQAGHR